MTLSRKAAHPGNVDGNFFVDHTCIDCDTCRWMAPKTFGRVSSGGQSVVYSQPATEEETTKALQAMVTCPTGSIRTRKPEKMVKTVRDSFPLAVDSKRIPQVFHLGYASEKSFGAVAYLVTSKTPEGEPFNILMDSPRFSSHLAKALDAVGGVQYMVLSHKDDVGDMNRWKERFPDMQRIMHKIDVRTEHQWPYIDMTGVERQLEGSGPWEVADGVKIVYTPGHSQGSVSLIVDGEHTGGDGVAFTGDHLALSARLGRLDGFARFSDDTDQQADSMAKLADEDILWILPGHGRRHSFDSALEREEGLRAAAEAYRRDPTGQKAPGPLFAVV